MSSNDPGKDRPERPFLIRQVTQSLALTGLFMLAIAMLALAETIRTLMQHTLSVNLLCVYLMLILAGGFGGMFHLFMARAFDRLDKLAYRWVRSTSWSPLVAVVTSNGRRLDWPEVKEAFGITEAPKEGQDRQH